jgi:hypothetical protein
MQFSTPHQPRPHTKEIRKMRFNRTAIAATATIALAGIGTGTALAATGTTSTTPAEQQTALISSLATKLNVTSDQVKAALVATAKERVAAALKAGDITQAQADAANARIDAGGMLLGPIGGPGGHRGGPGGKLGDPIAAAATYLGVTPAALKTELDAGKTLATVAKEKGKTAADLEAALVANAKAQLDKDTTLTDAQKTQILTDVTARTKDMVENGRPAGDHGPGGRGHGGGFGGPSGSSLGVDSLPAPGAGA